jgi:DNA polymerase elongation subunit (family B)
MKILLLDIETAPHKVYVWGFWDQDVGLNQIEEPGYTLCWAAKWLGDKAVFFSSINDGKEAMLTQIYNLVEEADVVVHYNGTKFDMPTLNKEWAEIGLPPPAPYSQIDLFKVVKKQFRFPSNKLDYVSRELGLGKKHAHKGMELWRECMSGVEASWRTMETYNKQDVKLLERLYSKLLPWINNHPNRSLFDRTSVDGGASCPNCGSNHLQRRGYHRTKTLAYQRYQCQDCGAWSKERTAEKVDKEVKKNILAGI